MNFLIIMFIIMGILVFVLNYLFRLNNNPLNNVESYRIYYRKINDKILKDMSNKDLVIVEGSFFNKAEVDYLVENNTKVVGYLSLMEIGNWDKGLIDKLSESDYLTIEDKKVSNPVFNNFVGDIREENFQEALMEILEERVMAKGMDGVFLDTVDWIDYYQDNEEIFEELKDGYYEFLTKVEEKYPSIIIIQNRGFATYLEFSCNHVDGVLWENFYSPYIDDDSYEISRLEDLKKTSRRKRTKVLTISFDEGNESKELSQQLGWTHLQSQMENRYSKWDFSK